jgi:hypothetical protein
VPEKRAGGEIAHIFHLASLQRDAARDSFARDNAPGREVDSGQLEPQSKLLVNGISGRVTGNPEVTQP